MEGRHFLSVFFRHVLHDLTEGGIVHVHVGHINNTGQLILFAELPGFFRTHFHACLAVYHDNGGSCGT